MLTSEEVVQFIYEWRDKYFFLNAQHAQSSQMINEKDLVSARKELPIIQLIYV